MKRTDKDRLHPTTHATGEALKFLDHTDKIGLQTGRWYRFVFRLAPGVGPSSGVSMWLNGAPALINEGPWGYSPPSLSATPTYAVKLGIYRAAQDASQEITLDSIRWGLSRFDVDPDNFVRNAGRK